MQETQGKELNPEAVTALVKSAGLEVLAKLRSDAQTLLDTFEAQLNRSLGAVVTRVQGMGKKDEREP